MSPDQLAVFMLCNTFIAFTLHVAVDNTLAAIRWAKSRTSGTYRHVSPNTLTRKLER
jgi:hypothetical protein